MMRSPTLLVALVAACSSGYPELNGGRSSSLSEAELALTHSLSPAASDTLDHAGFVIVENRTPASFHFGYDALFHAHLPVYVTADALLHAWHTSYDHILVSLERDDLIPRLGALLSQLRSQLAGSHADTATRADLDVYLAVAQSLANGAFAEPVAGGDRALIAKLFRAGQDAEGNGLELFGVTEQFDFSMFKPRGHYADDPLLARYFRAMSWLGRAQIRIGDKRGSEPWQINRRALRGALLLAAVFDDHARADWTAIDRTLETMVGAPDSMSLPGLAAATEALHGDLDHKSDDEIAAAFGAPAREQIRTQLVYGGDRIIGFLLLGQRFVPDAKVLSDLTYGSLATEPPRMMPTPLDVGYAMLHNASARALLAPQIATYGAPYETALEGEAREPLHERSIYELWLQALRALSPTRADKLPAPLTSELWARRMLAGQLASWAELRHDNILYAKQSVTGMALCEYPDAYIDPYPEFYAAMERLARKSRAAIETLPKRTRSDTSVLAYFDRMAEIMSRLHAIAVRERANERMTSDDLAFINQMVALEYRGGGCTVITEAEGWYADLYFDKGEALWHKPVVADVHTQPTDENGSSVGRVLHVGIGMPEMIVVTIQHDGGAHAQTYRGFVASYGEQITQGFRRLTDEDWRTSLGGRAAPPPAWLAPVVVHE